MKIMLNGKEAEIQSGCTLRQLLESYQIQPEIVACELNLKIIKRGQYSSTVLTEGDRLEVLRMIGGG